MNNTNENSESFTEDNATSENVYIPNADTENTTQTTEAATPIPEPTPEPTPEPKPEPKPIELKPTFSQALAMNWFTKDAEPAIAKTIKNNNMSDMPIRSLKDPVKISKISKIYGILGIDSFMLGAVWVGVGRLLLTVFAVILGFSPLLNKLTATLMGLPQKHNEAVVVPIIVLAVVIGAVSICMWIISIFTARNRTRELNTIRFAQLSETRGAIIGGFTIKDLVKIGLLAALVFVSTMFLRVPIPTAIGETQIKIGNVVCLLAGILLGGVNGGLAAGFGSFLFDLTNPTYIASSPSTFINFFLMAYICGGIAYANNKNLEVTKDKISITYTPPTANRIICASVIGAFSYFLLYSAKTILELMLLGNDFDMAFKASQPKLTISLANAIIAATITSLTGKIVLDKWNYLTTYKKSR